MADSLITPEVLALVGTETPPERNRFPISEEMAFDVADAIEDANPLYVDRTAAEASGSTASSARPWPPGKTSRRPSATSARARSPTSRCPSPSTATA